MSIFTNPSKVWHNLVAATGKLFDNVEEQVQDFANPLLHDFMKAGGTLLVSLATEAVAAAESQGGSGAEKFDVARKIIENGLKGEGIALVENTIRAAIEVAVAALRASQKTAPTEAVATSSNN